MKITMNVNGDDHLLDLSAARLLVHVIRDDLGLTGTHIGCDSSSCGACTVLLDGKAMKSCAVLAVQADGRSIETIESVAAPDALSPLQEAFSEHHALQCGYCTPGFVMAATAYLRHRPLGAGVPDRQEVRRAISGNLCRCTGYQHIVDAIMAAIGDGA
jgi:aerobic-type carbon monoxide dehydrogenase small subunit (CoxS/CutS family)